ncbi:hypothetical protein JOM56_010117 [Amanita muscaria]
MENHQALSESKSNDSSVSSTTSESDSSESRHSISNAEASLYYLGLPSRPRLVYRTGTTPWTEPRGPEAYGELKELRPVFGHKLNTIWNDLGPKVCDILDSVGVLWTSIDVVRFIKVGKGEVVGPVVVWIGVAPKTLFGKDAHTAAHRCLDLLKEFGITDVEVEYRESIYTQSAGPNLLEVVDDEHPTVDVCGPLTPALGLSIAAQATPQVQGTGGLYLVEGSDSKTVLLLTARHVLFPNDNYTKDTCSGHNVLLLGTGAFDNLVESIKEKITIHRTAARIYNLRIEKEADIEKRKEIQRLLHQTNNTTEVLEKFLGCVTNEWTEPSQRILGHIVCSPPITLSAGTEGFTEDYAIVELDSTKIEKVFRGNVIDLGMKIPSGKFEMKMSPRPDATFEFPEDRLLKLHDVIKEDELHKPDTCHTNGDPCLPLIKSGISTGVTIGCGNGINSLVRKYYNDSETVTHHGTSKEWAILPYDSKSGVFSAPGDSGSIIADRHGRIGGLITGGCRGQIDSLDITYATPFYWLLQRIRDNGFPSAHLNPVMGHNIDQNDTGTVEVVTSGKTYLAN